MVKHEKIHFFNFLESSKSTATSPRLEAETTQNNVLEILANVSLKSIEAQNSCGGSDTQSPPRNLYSSMESTSSALSPTSSGTPTEMPPLLPVMQSPNVLRKSSKTEENAAKIKVNFFYGGSKFEFLAQSIAQKYQETSPMFILHENFL